MILKLLWSFLIFLWPVTTSAQQIKDGFSLILGQNSYELNEPVPLEGLASNLWVHNPFGYQWEYSQLTASGGGLVFGMKYYAGPRFRWRKITPTFHFVSFEDGLSYMLAKDPIWEEVNVPHSISWRKSYLGFGIEAPVGKFIRLAISGNHYFRTGINAHSDFYNHQFRARNQNFTSIALSLSFSFPTKIGEWRLGTTNEFGRHFVNTTFPMTASSTTHFEIPLGFIRSPTKVLISEHQLAMSNLRYRVLRTESRLNKVIIFRQYNNGVQDYTTLSSRVKGGIGSILFFNLIFIEDEEKDSIEMCVQFNLDEFSWTGLTTLSHIALIGDNGKAVYFLPTRAFESQCGHLISKNDLEHLIYSDRIIAEFHVVGFGIVIRVDNMLRVQQNWRILYEDYLRERFETSSEM